MRFHLQAVNLLNKIGKIIGNKEPGRGPLTVIVEGNIGSGKTTFLNHFQKNSNFCVLSEPVDMWRNCRGHNLLALLYEDPKRWAFTFQSYVLLTMFDQHASKTERPVKLMERSLYSARYCFVDNMLREGIMPPISGHVLDEQFDWLLKKPETRVDLVVYLRTSPDVVYARMLQRNREEEKTVPLEYLRKLHECHENWLYHKTAYSRPAPVLVLDANMKEEAVVEEYVKSARKIFERLRVAGVGI